MAQCSRSDDVGMLDNPGNGLNNNKSVHEAQVLASSDHPRNLRHLYAYPNTSKLFDRFQDAGLAHRIQLRACHRRKSYCFHRHPRSSRWRDGEDKKRQGRPSMEFA